MTRRSAHGSRGAFTLVEVLVASAILVLMMGFLMGVMDQTTRIWSGTVAKVEQFREARVGFERVTTRLAQATLNTYWDYDSDTSTPPKPKRYARRSELRFISGSAATLIGPTGPTGTTGTGARVSHAVFFNAPLGIIGNPNYTGLANALNSIGFFVELADDTEQRPPFITTAMIPARWRFRLMEFAQPTENFSVYQFTNGAGATNYFGSQWFTNDVNGASTDGLKRVVAENVIAFIITPRLAKAEEQPLQSNATHSPLASNFSYNSTGTNANPQLNPKNQLPPVVQLTMIAIDERSAEKLGLSATTQADIFKISTLFADTAKFTADLATLESTLGASRVRYRIFTTNVHIRAAKWSREQIN